MFLVLALLRLTGISFTNFVSFFLSYLLLIYFVRLKTIMQLQTTTADAKFSGVLSGLRYIWGEGGIRGFFQGNGLNCVKIFPESAAKFFVYENMKQIIAGGVPSPELTIWQRFIAGSIAGAISQVYWASITLLLNLNCVVFGISSGLFENTYGSISNSYSCQSNGTKYLP